VWYHDIHSASFSFVTIHVSDRQTERETGRIATAILWVALHAYPQHAYRHMGISSTPVHMTNVVK